MSQTLRISAAPPDRISLDYARLREGGMQSIRALAKDSWTDHNVHDPGITLLEAASYAITELGLKLQLDIADLLRSGQAHAEAEYEPAHRVLPVGPVGGDEGPKTDFGWEVWPRALHDVVVRITRELDRPRIEITENGCSYLDGPGPDGRIRDARRIEFLRGYLEALARAIDAGADVRGYHAWSLLDNFEWSEGYEQRFGLAWVDFSTQDRRLKDSGRWYGQVAAENGFET